MAVFRNAISFDQELKWNLSNVETIASMFEGAATFNQELGSWDTSNLMDARRLFKAATSFKDGSISSWDVSRMVNLDEMFSGASSFNGDLGNWNLTNVKSLRQMFAGADSFHQNLCNWWKYMLSNEPVTDGMFDKSGCPSSANPFVTVRDAGPLCHYCSTRPCNDDSAVQCLPLMHGDELRKVIAAYRLDSSRYTAVASTYGHPIGKWNTSQLEDFRYAFFRDYTFTDDISEWDTSNAVSMVSMFNGASWFRGDLSSWDVSRVIYTSDMFKNAEWFNQDISMWNLSRIHYADRMFYGAARFNQNLCDWRTRFLFNETRRVDDMFSYSGCPNKSSPLRVGSGPYCHECPFSASLTSIPSSSSGSPMSSPSADYPLDSTTVFPVTWAPFPTKMSSSTPSVYQSVTPISPRSGVPSVFPTLPITSDFPYMNPVYEAPDKSGHYLSSGSPTSELSAFPTVIQHAPDDPSGGPSPLTAQTLPPLNASPTGSSSETSRCSVLKPLQFALCIWAMIMN